MKKHSAFLMLLASAAILLGACAKEEAGQQEEEKTIILGVPANLKSSDASGIVTLSWSAVDKADGYVWEIYDWKSSLVATSKTRNLSVTVEQLYTGRPYTARVKAVAGTKSSSDFSESIQFFPGGTEVVFFKGRSVNPDFKWAATDSVLISDGVSKAVYVPSQTDTTIAELCPAAGEPLLNPQAALFTALYPKNSENIPERKDTILYSPDIPSINASASTDAASRELVFAPSGGLLHIAATNSESIPLRYMKVGTEKTICAGDTLTVDFTKSSVSLSQAPLDIYILMPSGAYSDLTLVFEALKADPAAQELSAVITDGGTTELSASLDIHSKALNLSLSFDNSTNLLTASTTVLGQQVESTVYYEIGTSSLDEVTEPTTASEILPGEGLALYGSKYYVKALAVKDGETSTSSISFNASLVMFGTNWTYDTTAVGFGQSFKRYIDEFGKANFINGESYSAYNLTVWNSSTETFSAAFYDGGCLRVQANDKVRHKFTVGSTGAGKLRLNISSKDPGYTKNRKLTVEINGTSYYSESTGIPDVGKGNDPTSGWVDIDIPADKIKSGDVITIHIGYCRLYGIYWQKADTTE